MPVRRSKNHAKMVEAIKKRFSSTRIIEEHLLRSDGKNFLIDLYLPQMAMAFEVQGEQHLEYSAFFHAGRKENFGKQIMRDVEKVKACKDSGIELIYIFPDDDVTVEFLNSLIEEKEDERHYPCRA